MTKDRLPQTASPSNQPAKKSSASAIADFIKTAKQTGTESSGRLVFALDATMSREATWDMACTIQAEMFNAVAQAGGLNVQLVYFRGFGECKASKWVANAKALSGLMTGISCRGGQTQIAKVLAHTLKETQKNQVAALVYIGDAMEENVDRLCQLAGELGLRGTKLFLFLEGRDALAEKAYREMARLSGGAFLKLGANSARELAELLAAIAIYANGGYRALEGRGDKSAQRLLKQMR